MVTSHCNQIDEAVHLERERILNSLHETFGARFRLVSFTKPGTWRYVATDELLATHASQVEGDIAAACDRIVDSDRPAIVDSLDTTDHIVAVPVPMSIGTPKAAVAVVKGFEEDVLRRLATLWVESASNAQLVEKLSSDCHNLTQQLSEGLEELSFMRSMVCCLDLSNGLNDLISLAQEIFLELKDVVHTECLALLLSPEGLDPLESIPTLCVGNKQVPDSLLLRVVEWFGKAAQDQPVLKNNLHITPEGGNWPGIRDFILVPMKTNSRRLGWILAVNRIANEDTPNNQCWRSGPMEFGTSEASLLSTTSSVLATYASNGELLQEKEQILVSVVRSLVSALDAKDEYTCGHSERVALYAKVLAKRAGYGDNDCERIYMTGLLHDVGKIGVSDAVLKKSSKLTEAEFEEIKRHPDEGWAILQDLAQLNYVVPGVLHHHEQVNGSGYPDGLIGDEIPMDGRILSIVDAWDAMTSDRPYRKGMPTEQAKQILVDGAGSQWDAELVELFLNVFDKIELIRKTFRVREKPVRSASRTESNNSSI